MSEQNKSWGEMQKEERGKAFELINSTAERLFAYGDDPTVIEGYINLAGKIRGLSVANTLLLLHYHPEATEIATSQQWNERGARIKRGEHGFYLLERVGDYVKADGTTGKQYKAVKYFDVSQTNAKPMLQTVNTYPPELFRQAIIKQFRVPVKPNTDDELPDAALSMYYPQKQLVVISQGLTHNEFVFETVTCLALAMMDRGSTFFVPDYIFDARCVAYIVASKWNVNVGSHTFPRVPEMYGELDAEQVKNKLYSIKRTADQISIGIYKFLEKNLGKDKMSADANAVDNDSINDTERNKKQNQRNREAFKNV